jgi:hypothetical protein
VEPAAVQTLERMTDYLREDLGVMLPGSDLIYLNAFDLIMVL